MVLVSDRGNLECGLIESVTVEYLGDSGETFFVLLSLFGDIGEFIDDGHLIILGQLDEFVSICLSFRGNLQGLLVGKDGNTESQHQAGGQGDKLCSFHFSLMCNLIVLSVGFGYVV